MNTGLACLAVPAFLLGTSGCIVVHDHGPPSSVEAEVYATSAPPEVVVEQEPPAVRVELMPAPPTLEHVWIAGHWGWAGHWVWVQGAWCKPPHPHAGWVPGHWHRHPRGWVWVGGSWR
jgi:hypothetical protein